MDTITDRIRLISIVVANRVAEARHNDRGDFNSNVAWTGAMVLAAVTIAGIVVAKAEAFADAIDFGP